MSSSMGKKSGSQSPPSSCKVSGDKGSVSCPGGGSGAEMEVGMLFRPPALRLLLTLFLLPPFWVLPVLLLSPLLSRPWLLLMLLVGFLAFLAPLPLVLEAQAFAGLDVWIGGGGGAPAGGIEGELVKDEDEEDR